jgi:hypothetical protein
LLGCARRGADDQHDHGGQTSTNAGMTCRRHMASQDPGLCVGNANAT